MRLPDVITLPAIPIFFLSGFAPTTCPGCDRLIGAAAGYLFLRLIADFYYYVLKREGLGLGRRQAARAHRRAARLAGAAVRAVRGRRSRASLISLPIAAVDAPAARPRSDADEPLRHTQIPFGPFLAGAALAYVFVGPRLLALIGG